MKKLLSISLMVGSLFAYDYQIGGGIGTHNVTNSPIDDYGFLNVRIGKTLPKNHILRIELEKSTSIEVNKNDSSLTRLLLNVEYHFNTNLKITPYSFIGGGYQWVKNYNDRSVADFGIGGRYNIQDKLNIFAETRIVRNFVDNDNHFGLIVGVVYNFNK